MLYFITHPEVVIDPGVLVPDWPLSEIGRARISRLLDRPWVRELSAVYASTERKAMDGAEIITTHLGLSVVTVESLGENDRSSTGYLPEAEFQATADAFFANPEESVRGWETAIAAQERIFAAVTTLLGQHESGDSLAIVSHGGVGALLLCRLLDVPISRTREQPGKGGGHYFAIDNATLHVEQQWTPIDA